MSTYSRILLSQSTSGLPVKVAATAIASGTTIHTAVAGALSFDEVYLWVTNTDSSDRFLTIGWGGVTDPDNLVSKSVRIPSNSGPTPVVMGLVLNGGLLVKASADTANVLTISGYANRIAP